MNDAAILFRPVGAEELRLIAESDYVAFPPRLPGQPIFYPVLNEEYATQIARDWNAKNSTGRVGYVTRFAAKNEYLAQFEVRKVGGAKHLEYWIPAEGLEEFNQNIVGKIEVIAESAENENASDLSQRRFEFYVLVPEPASSEG